MFPGSKVIIADTSCLILLSKIKELDLLKLPGRRIYITSVISKEFNENLPDWLQIIDPENDIIERIIEMNLDRGEATAIALSLTTENSILIIDDLKGRKIAEKLDLRFSGTMGLILRAKKEGIISEVKPILNKIKSTNFRFNKEIFSTVLKEAGEK
jgi:predicted nucleic acid-binding protein